MGERIDNDSVYNGSMTRYEFYQAEFETDDGLPELVEPELMGIKGKINGEEIVLTRNNVKIYEFNWHEDSDGFRRDFDFMSHIYIHRGEGKPPFWYHRPDDEDEQKQYYDLVKRLVMIDCDYIQGLPRTLDFEHFYNHFRGEEPIDDVIEQILE
jgi:hypothetical protein